MKNQIKEIGPQPGPQEMFSSTSADIAIYGGSAGSGKSFSLLLEPLRHYHNKLFEAIFFRRTFPELTMPGGLWKEALKLYSPLRGKPHGTNHEITFPSGCQVKFSGMQYEDDVENYQGAQIPLIGFDELTHFVERQFFYMMSRNRSDSGVDGYMRATCNPDPDSWVRHFIDWWIDNDTGYPIPSRAGKLRHFIRSEDSDKIEWRDKPFSVGPKKSKSVTFVPALIQDNKILLEKNPGYLAGLHALPYIDRMALLHGNWNVKAAAGAYFKRSWFEIVDALPAGTEACRYWDRAASESITADWTVGVKMHKAPDGTFYISDVTRFRGRPLRVEQTVFNTATLDTKNCTIGIEQDPGQAGVSEADSYVRMLAGFNVRVNRVSTSKETRAKPLSAQAERGNIKLLRGPWNEAFLSELESFPDPSSKDDQVDAASGAFTLLTSEPEVGKLTPQMVRKREKTFEDRMRW